MSDELLIWIVFLTIILGPYIVPYVFVTISGKIKHKKSLSSRDAYILYYEKFKDKWFIVKDKHQYEHWCRIVAIDVSPEPDAYTVNGNGMFYPKVKAFSPTMTFGFHHDFLTLTPSLPGDAAFKYWMVGAGMDAFSKNISENHEKAIVMGLENKYQERLKQQEKEEKERLEKEEKERLEKEEAIKKRERMNELHKQKLDSKLEKFLNNK